MILAVLEPVMTVQKGLTIAPVKVYLSQPSPGKGGSAPNAVAAKKGQIIGKFTAQSKNALKNRSSSESRVSCGSERTRFPAVPAGPLVTHTQAPALKTPNITDFPAGLAAFTC